MEAHSIPVPYAPPAVPTERARGAPLALPWPLAATLFAALSITVGIIWDISWHMSIGRDTFWTPAHMAVYVGGLVGGLANGYLIVRTTFAGTDAERARGVRVWGFRGPLGSFVSCWGAGAMLVSAPFDDWWHNAYGLDVEILSPPHSVLMLGIVGIVAGAMLTALAFQNAAEAGEYPTGRTGPFRLAYAFAAGVLLTIVSIGAFEYTRPVMMHSARFVRATAWVMPLVLCAVARASRLRWPATAAALLYMGVFAAMTWVLPLFPATPKLGPIYYPVAHMVPLGFPLLLAAPALGIDLVVRRWGERHAWLAAALAGGVFVVVTAAVHWPFGTFMLSLASHTWFFAGDNYNYSVPATSYTRRGVFPSVEKSAAEYWTRLAWATLVAVLSARLGLGWGGWMRRVRR